MEEKAVLNNLRRNFSVVNNNSSSIITTANGSLCNNSSYLYGEGMKLQLKSQSQSRLYANAMLGSYQFYEAPRLYSSQPPQPPLLPLPFSSNIKKKIRPSSENNIKKKKKKKIKKPAFFPKPATKEVLAAEYKEEEEEEEEEEFFLSPPPSSLPLPRLLLTARPKATSCFAEPDTGATNDLRRLLRL